MSLVATDIGGTDIIGVGGAAFSHGMAVANFEWIGCVPAMIVGAFVFIPFFYRTGVYTVPEFLECRYNSGVRSVVAICWLLFMACNLGIMLLASAKMMSAVCGWDEMACIVVTAVLVGAYTFIGGLAAVVYTDMIQCVVMIAGCLLILVLGLVEVGGIGELRSRLAAADARSTAERAERAAEDSDPGESAAGDHTNVPATERTALILPVDTQTPFPWPGIYFGLALILSPAYWIGNQAIVQRSLGARSEFEAKASYVWGALLKNVIPLIVAVPGLIAVALLPDLRDGDAAIPSLVGVLLPAGLRGLFVAAFLAALMSSIDSYLNSAATIVANDFYKRFVDRDVSDERLLTVGRVITIGLWQLAGRPCAGRQAEVRFWSPFLIRRSRPRDRARSCRRTVVTPLHQFGEFLRQCLQMVPLSAVRILFVGSLVALLFWVLRLPRTVTTPPGGARRWDENLKLGAAVALLIQILIYCCL